MASGLFIRNLNLQSEFCKAGCDECDSVELLLKVIYKSNRLESRTFLPQNVGFRRVIAEPRFVKGAVCHFSKASLNLQ